MNLPVKFQSPILANSVPILASHDTANNSTARARQQFSAQRKSITGSRRCCHQHKQEYFTAWETTRQETNQQLSTEAP